MNTDAFSKRHPLVNFVFFLGAIGFGVMIQHPIYLLAGILCGGTYYLLLNGKKGWKMIFATLPLFLIMTFINPLVNTDGTTVLFTVLGRPYTLEALVYGGALASIFMVTILWFGCYNAVMTSDKFSSLFGNLIPALSLLLIMVLRMIPNLIRKAKQISGARMSVGKGIGEQAENKEKLVEGITVLSALTSWALEGSVITGDSMRSRGYGTAKRSSFMIYRMTAVDWSLLVVQVLFALVLIAAIARGATTATFTPEWYIAPVSGTYLSGFIAYCAYLFIPTVLHIKEAVQWHISRSKI